MERIDRPDLRPDVSKLLRSGTCIPAVPLAQQPDGSFDPRYQRALARYYVDAGAGGVAVGVHSTQFEIRNPEFDLYEPVLTLMNSASDEWNTHNRPFVKIAGVAGETKQAVAEARLAAQIGYDIGLVSLSALDSASDDQLIEHCKSIATEISIMGFYLQPAVGGRYLGFNFWRRFADIDGVVAIKIS
ncbi:MAG: dihydrodipicolinate synthase family protein, partial [Rhodothermales bacterium]|nr:dihydrodipicolinate synthase family protein [Rhodothermales bacterium]